jgi:hypothetical protein
VAGCCEHGNELWRSVKFVVFSTEELLASEAGLCRMHTVPRYEQVSLTAVCAHDDFITLGAACCDQNRYVAVQYAVMSRRTCCVRYVREVLTVAKAATPLQRPVSDC